MSPLTEPTRIVLKNYNAPAAIAGVAPTLDYRFALDRRELDAVSLTDKLTVTRAATAAVNGPTGYLELAGPNVARFDHNLTTHQSLGLLVEESGTNLFTYSLFDDWSAINIQKKSTNNPAPDGTNTAVIIGDATSASTNSWLSLGLNTVDGNPKTFTFYAKRTTAGQSAFIDYYDAGSTRARGAISLDDGSVSYGVQIGDAVITSSDAGNGWWRCQLTLTPDGGSVFTWRAGNNANGDIYIWGAQLETDSTATTYIPTTGSTVTRTESASIDGTGVITGTYTMVEKPTGCAVVNGTNIDIQPGYTAERVMVFPAALSSEQITAIRSVM